MIVIKHVYIPFVSEVTAIISSFFILYYFFRISFQILRDDYRKKHPESDSQTEQPKPNNEAMTSANAALRKAGFIDF